MGYNWSDFQEQMLMIIVLIVNKFKDNGLYHKLNTSLLERCQMSNSKEFYSLETGIKDSCAWIAPNGTFYPCHSWEHDALANSICRTILGFKGYGTQELEKRQWIRVDEKYLVVYHLKNKPTQRQIDTLFDLRQITNRDILKQQIDRIINESALCTTYKDE